jgi:subtilisin family serine protease
MIDFKDITLGDKDVIVAVVDTGVDEKCTVFKNNSIISGWDYYNYDDSIYDEYIYDYHGTYVCTTISRVAPETSILPIKFMESTKGNIEDAISAIEYAIQNGAKIINCSWNFYDYNESLFNLMKKNSQVLFVCAAGNYNIDMDEAPLYPCSYQLENLITVMAIDNTGELLSSSGYGKISVDVAAPGKNVKVILPENKEGYIDGTSVATAFVSGMSALILAKNQELSPIEVKNIIISSTRKLPSLSEKCLSGGIIDIGKAVQF